MTGPSDKAVSAAEACITYDGVTVKETIEAAYPIIRAEVIDEVAQFLADRPDSDGYYFWGPMFAGVIRSEFK